MSVGLVRALDPPYGYPNAKNHPREIRFVVTDTMSVYNPETRAQLALVNDGGVQANRISRHAAVSGRQLRGKDTTGEV